jgi:hypothetical protein
VAAVKHRLSVPGKPISNVALHVDAGLAGRPDEMKSVSREHLPLPGGRPDFGVVQSSVTLETRNPIAGAASLVFGVTSKSALLNHAECS